MRNCSLRYFLFCGNNFFVFNIALMFPLGYKDAYLVSNVTANQSIKSPSDTALQLRSGGRPPHLFSDRPSRDALAFGHVTAVHLRRTFRCTFSVSGRFSCVRDASVSGATGPVAAAAADDDAGRGVVPAPPPSPPPAAGEAGGGRGADVQQARAGVSRWGRFLENCLGRKFQVYLWLNLIKLSSHKNGRALYVAPVGLVSSQDGFTKLLQYVRFI